MTLDNNHLDMLEDKSIYILREAFATIENLGMLWSFGKDSQAVLWMARKAFFGRVPFKVVHVDTSYEPPEMYAFRDRIAKEWSLDLVVSRNGAELAGGMNYQRGRIACCMALKTDALKQALGKLKFTGVIAGIRRDEEGTRAKERVFSPRDEEGRYDVRNQPPELWDVYGCDFRPGGHVRVHPLLHWTELDVWRYIRRENIPIVDLYFARDGRRYRSLGCAPCTDPVPSNAATVDDIIVELLATRVPERAGRMQDKEAEDAFERLRAAGHM
jgi:sulfate adenylyltransferase subunit 2